ncbi:MAG: hypothetical protein ACREQF_12590, partial [Candidatus Binataceae bacterium]
YDGLLGKLVAWAPTRDEARRRLLNALDEFSLLGVRHTAEFLHDVVASGAFERADLSTELIDDFFDGWRPNDDRLEHALVAAALAVSGALASDGARLAADHESQTSGRTPWTDLTGFELWKRR